MILNTLFNFIRNIRFRFYYFYLAKILLAISERLASSKLENLRIHNVSSNVLGSGGEGRCAGDPERGIKCSLRQGGGLSEVGGVLIGYYPYMM